MKRHSFFYTQKTATWYSALLLFLIAVLFSHNALCAEKYLTDTKKYYIQQIQTGIYNDNYQLAHSFADSLININTQDPLGYLFKAAVYLGDMTNAEENHSPRLFNNLIDRTILLGEENILVVDSNRAAWNYLCIGHAHAYRSLYESRFGSMATALKNGFRAKSAYHDGLKYDSSVYDIYGGLGMYHYWKSAKAGFLRWIHVFNDDKQKGIDELYLTIDSSEVSADVAWSSLIWIYLDAKQYDTSIVIAQKMYQKYPEGKTFLWALAKIYFKSERYEKSIEVYQLLYDKLMLKQKNYFNIIESEFHIYKAYKKLGNNTKAHEIAKRFMYYINKAPIEIRKQQKNKVKVLVKEATS